jgi:hypothetical protein
VIFYTQDSLIWNLKFSFSHLKPFSFDPTLPSIIDATLQDLGALEAWYGNTEAESGSRRGLPWNHRDSTRAHSFNNVKKAHPLKTAHSNPPFKYRRLVCAFNSMTLATYKVLVVFLRHCAFHISGFFVRKKVVIERRMRIFMKARGIFCALQTMRL